MFNKINKTFRNGFDEIFEITLKNGRKINCTKDHKWSVGGVFKNPTELKPKDLIDVKIGSYDNIQEHKLKSYSFVRHRNDMNSIVYETPDEMSPRLSYLIGCIFSNGCFSECKSRIRFIHQREDIVSNFVNIFNEIFNSNLRYSRSKDRDAYDCSIGSIHLFNWFKLNELDKPCKSKDISIIPISIRSSSLESILAFYAGYADGDGCFHTKSFCIDSSSEKFIRHMQEVGESIGLVFGICHNTKGGNFQKEKSIYKIHAYRTYSTKLSFEIINKYSIKAIARPVEISINKERTINPFVVVSVNKKIEPNYTADIEVEKSHLYLNGGLISHNTSSIKSNACSPGTHRNPGEYFIRRVRINSYDPLAKTARKLGWSIHPEIGQMGLNYLGHPRRSYEFDVLEQSEKDRLLDSADTWVIDFPVKTNCKVPASSESAISQLERYKMVMQNWCDHNASTTIYVDKHEWDDVTRWVYDNWDDFVGIAFLPLSTDAYDLAPYELIDEKKYLELKSEFSDFDYNLLEKIEREEVESERDIEIPSCESGLCEIPKREPKKEDCRDVLNEGG